VETWQFDTLLPLTAKGRVAWACEMARAQAIRLVKSNDALWSLLKQLRTRVAGGKPAAQD
jgi:CelD/BcsL family acetyltransferase involved in cellulose biosynthesis